VTAEFSPEQEQDSLWMQRALEQARAALTDDEVPIGAVIVQDGRLLAEAYNLTRTAADPTAHAELIAIRRAAARLGGWRLLDTTIYVTLEPCAMCAGAIVLARLQRVVFGAFDPTAGMCGSLGCVVQDRRLNHRTALTVGVLAEPAADLLRSFFRQRR
jgi:tRNA(adenine34) deaminase